MTKYKMFFAAFALSLIMPVEAAGNNMCWWALMYPELCGIEDEDCEIGLMAVDIAKGCIDKIAALR